MPLVHVATARIYRSHSRYGSSLQVPSNNPLRVDTDKGRLEVWFGQIPAWIRSAEGRVPIWADAMLRGFKADHAASRVELEDRLSVAEQADLERGFEWSVALILFSTEEWQDSDVRDAQWCWFVGARPVFAARARAAEAASLDLGARVATKFVPNVFSGPVFERVYVSIEESFERAYAHWELKAGDVRVDVGGLITDVEDAIAKGDLSRALQRAMLAPAVAKDTARLSRIVQAATTDRLADHIVSSGRYELYRAMQPALMLATTARPLAVMFVDMNGLGELNKAAGQAAGDAAIAAFATAVATVCPEDAFRIGGDEFVIFRLGEVDELVALGTRVLEAVNKRDAGGTPLSASIGVVLAADPCEDPRKIVDRADEQMRRAKLASKRAPRPSMLAVEERDVRSVS